MWTVHLIESEELWPLLDTLADKSREPGDYFTYVNRKTGAEATDIDFLCGYRKEEGKAFLRDQRVVHRGGLRRFLSRWLRMRSR